LDTIKHEYDYVFCGAGASACLMLLSLHRSKMLENKSVLLVDKERKEQRDKTFCFWSKGEESITQCIGDLISESWDTVILPNSQPSKLGSLRYNHVSSIDLYRRIDKLSEHYGWHRMIGSVDDIRTTNGNCHVLVNGCDITGAIIFDSRTPAFQKPISGETHIHQSFIGWYVSFHAENSNTHAFRFMDFNIDQQGYTQFVYVLPFSDGTALVEVTRFGNEIIRKEDAERLLTTYISNNFGGYRKLNEESGCIPMCNAPLETSPHPGVVQLGARNFNIKPSTGYAFKNMFYHAENIAENILKGKQAHAFNITSKTAKQGRFAFYDGLLLDILNKQPQFGKPIFEALFKHTRIERILSFLDERTHIGEEISIFSKLPLRPFLQAVGRKAISSMFFRAGLITLVCLILCALPNYDNITHTVLNAFLVLGLVAIGIPHGAVDHLLETKRWEPRVAPAFIARYLSIAGLMGGIWYFTPTFALLLFLLYSAWHFGQADGKLWRLSNTISLLWGASLLFYLLGTHQEETNIILSSMGCVNMPIHSPTWILLPWLIRFLYVRSISGALTVVWLTLSSQIPLMYAFGLYFIGQHSLTGWQHIKQHLGMSHQSIWLHALPFHLGAWFLLAIFFYAWQPAASGNETAGWGIFFIFLACISLPHALSMQTVYRKKESNPQN